MIKAKDAVVWVKHGASDLVVKPSSSGRPEGPWYDPIGAAYADWQKATDQQRVQLMLETAIDLAMQGYPLKGVLTAFAQVEEFRALGKESYPMCRALTSALVGQCLNPETMSFEELLVAYAPKEQHQGE